VKQRADEEAKKLFEEILEQHSDYIGSYYHLGKLLERNGASERAIVIF